MTANQFCGVCWATGKPGHECPSCQRPDCPFAERDKRRQAFFEQFTTPLDPIAGAADMLNESAKQHRQRGDTGHAAACDAAARTLRTTTGGVDSSTKGGA